MREILFRGKREDNGEWVYGYYYTQIITHAGNRKSRDHFMRTEQNIRYEVDPDTIGQYTGLQDKNGVKVFEGDIISAYNGRIKGPVIFDKRGLAFGVPNGPNEIYQFSMNFLESKDIKVIGNIHDNPELLGGDDT